MPYVIFALMAAFCPLYLRAERGGRKLKRSILKIIPTVSALILSLCGEGGASSLLISAGLVLCVIADWVLDYRFVYGTAIFGCAHVLFVITFILRGGITVETLAAFCICIMTFAALLSLRNTAKSSLGKLPACAYCVALCCLVASSVNAGGLCIAGALLFAFSDTLIGLRLFYGLGGKHSGWIIMAAYYGALYLIALSNYII